MADIIVITTGNELLYGGKTDTNAGTISRLLRENGFDVVRHVTVGDDRNSVRAAVEESLGAGAVIITGGLGPTDDDCTIESLRDLFHYEVIVHGPSLERMKSFFHTMGRDTTGADMKMVEVPENALVLENGRGLAPGFILEAPGCSIIALPGVPLEMEALMREKVLPYLTKKYSREVRESVLFRLVGQKESDINRTVLSWGFDYSGVAWGMTAEGGVTELYFTKKSGHGFDLSLVKEACRNSFGESLLREGFTAPEEELLAMLAEKHETIALAESCTGGLIAKRLTDIPGASRSFMGGIVAYDNAVKMNCLGVSQETLRSHGAVSQEVAQAMASGARRAMKATVAMATTGIAGPGGGSEEKPVGTVCFGFDIQGHCSSFTRLFSGDRERIRRIAAITAIDALRKLVKQR